MIVLCPECDTPHHTDCWSTQGGCSRFGCRSRVLAAPESPSVFTIIACPLCGLQIRGGAKKCRHCREFLDPALRKARRRTVTPGRVALGIAAAVGISLICTGFVDGYNAGLERTRTREQVARQAGQAMTAPAASVADAADGHWVETLQKVRAAYDGGNLATAEELCTKAQAILGAHSEVDSRFVTTLRWTANIQAARGRYHEATQSLRRAITARRAIALHTAADVHEVAELMRELADLHYQKQKYIAAEAAYTDLVSLLKGSTDRTLRGDLALTLECLGDVYTVLPDRLQDAEPVLRQSTEIRHTLEAVDGRLPLVGSLARLARVLRKSGRTVDSSNILREAEVILSAAKREDDPAYLEVAYERVLLAARQGDYGAAKLRIDRIVAVCERSFGSDDSRTRFYMRCRDEVAANVKSQLARRDERTLANESAEE